jgi:hypothetical protein
VQVLAVKIGDFEKYLTPYLETFSGFEKQLDGQMSYLNMWYSITAFRFAFISASFSGCSFIKKRLVMNYNFWYI